MALSNHERVGQMLELLRDGLLPFVQREYQGRYGDRWIEEAQRALGQQRKWQSRDPRINLDAQGLLTLLSNRWEEVFSKSLGRTERNLAGELRDFRNQWAHQGAFSTDDAYRALDSGTRLLQAVSAPEAEEVDRMRREVMRLRYEEENPREVPRPPTAPAPVAPGARPAASAPAKTGSPPSGTKGTRALRQGESYTRRQIHDLLGGGMQDYLPHTGGRVVCACLSLDLQPDAPQVVLPGHGPKIEEWARVWRRQMRAVPVFLKRGTNAWEYVGNYRVRDWSEDPAVIAEHARRAGRDDVSIVLFLAADEPDATA